MHNQEKINLEFEIKRFQGVEEDIKVEKTDIVELLKSSFDMSETQKKELKKVLFELYKSLATLDWLSVTNFSKHFVSVECFEVWYFVHHIALWYKHDELFKYYGDVDVIIQNQKALLKLIEDALYCIKLAKIVMNQALEEME